VSPEIHTHIYFLILYFVLLFAHVSNEGLEKFTDKFLMGMRIGGEEDSMGVMG